MTVSLPRRRPATIRTSLVPRRTSSVRSNSPFPSPAPLPPPPPLPPQPDGEQHDSENPQEVRPDHEVEAPDAPRAGQEVARLPRGMEFLKLCAKPREEVGLIAAQGAD